MKAQGFEMRKRIQRLNRVCLTLMLFSLVCALAIEAFHGHACTDNGCMLCLAATVAQALVVACASLTLVQPVLRAVASARPVRMSTCPVRDAVVAFCTRSKPRVPLTPVTLGVKLLI